MNKEIEEANRQFAKKLEEIALGMIKQAFRIYGGEVKEADVIAGTGASISILKTALDRYQAATPYGRKLIGIDRPKALFRVALYPEYKTNLNESILRMFFRDYYDDAKALADDVENCFLERGALLITAIFIQVQRGEEVQDLNLSDFKKKYLSDARNN